MNNRITVPIKKFENTEEVLKNSNFHKVKIYIMHTGKNYNGSIFSENSIDISINTLSNVPILGYVYTDENDNKDFKGHESELDIFTDEDGKIKFREYYKEQPIGVIPETNEYFKEEIDGEIYLGCYGYIWKCYSNDAYDILVEDDEKEVSMEILVKECSYDKKNMCNIDSFEFLGVTVLGAKVAGAMGGNCTLSMNFSTEEENKEFTETVDKLNNLLKHRKEGVMSMEEMTKFEEEVCPECGKNPCECDIEEEACKKKHSEEETEDFENVEEESCEEEVIEEMSEEVEEEYSTEEEVEEMAKDEEDEEEDVDVKEDESCKKKHSTEEFSLSLNNIFKSIRESLDLVTFEYTSCWGDTFECQKYYAEDLMPSDSIVILYDCEDGRNYGVKYKVVDDDVLLDLENKVEYIQEWREKNDAMVSFSLEKENELREAVIYNKVAEELHELRKFKSDIEEKAINEKLKEDIENILADFNFEESEISELKNKAINKEIDLEKFEDKLCVMEIKKQRLEKEKFSKINSENNGLSVLDNDNSEKEIPKYNNILERYGKKNK